MRKKVNIGVLVTDIIHSELDRMELEMAYRHLLLWSLLDYVVGESRMRLLMLSVARMLRLNNTNICHNPDTILLK